MQQRARRTSPFDVQDEIKRLILEKGLVAGDVLPSEAALIAVLGVSRGSLREAIKSLQARSILDVQHGRGTFVAHASVDSFVDGLLFRQRLSGERDAMTTAAELVDLRDILEQSMVQRVASNASQTLIGSLEEVVGRMEAAAERDESFHAADRRFHELLYSELGNGLLIEFVRAFWDVLDAVHPRLPSQLSAIVSDAQHHRVILSAVMHGDPRAARVAMKAHFEATHQLFGAVDRDASTRPDFPR